MARSTRKNPKPYYTPTEVADLLMVSPTTVRHWASKGRLKSRLTPGGHRRFTQADVEHFARENGLTLTIPQSERPRILIVDDDKDIANLLTDLLKNSPVKVTTKTTESGFEAGRLMSSFKPHIVLLDLMMPGIDGFEVCQNIKSDPATKATRVIAMTGFPNDENVVRILDAGAETCLSKPFSFETLLTEIGVG